MNPLTPCTIGLGSNSSDRKSQIDKAIGHICELLNDAHVSEIYECEAINGTDAPYLNAVVHGSSPLGMDELKSFLKAWETEQHRDDTLDENGRHVVNIDLDLVIFDSRILRPKDFDRLYFNKGYSQLLASGAFQNDIV